jgi:hypothetical protein
MERSGCAPRIELAVAADGLIGWERLDLDTALAQPVRRLSLGPHLSVCTGADEQALGQLAEHAIEVGEDERVTVLAPPIRDDAVGQHDHIPRLLFAVDNDPTEAVSLDPRHDHLRSVAALD